MGQRSVGQTAVGQVEVLLRDFDGTRSIYPTDLPLREVIHTAQTELGIDVGKTYVRTEERDERGRTIYAERV
jgi:hypothetical protein